MIFLDRGEETLSQPAKSRIVLLQIQERTKTMRRREIEFPTEWAIPPVLEQDEAGYEERPDSPVVNADFTTAEEAVNFAPETSLPGTYY
jgi:hypothetical protein